jgi:CheY-like chemotaxis protein
MKILIVEDDNERIKWFRSEFSWADLHIYEDAQPAIEKLEKDSEWDVIFLDHDLGWRVFVASSDSNTGYQVAKKIAELGIKAPVIIHSQNIIGADNIKDALSMTNECFVLPFPQLKRYWIQGDLAINGIYRTSPK